MSCWNLGSRILICIIFFNWLSLANLEGATSFFINPMKCWKKEMRHVQCIITKFDATNETLNGIKTLIPADTEVLVIFCSSQAESTIRRNSFTHLFKVRSIKFWDCRFTKNPFEELDLPSSIRSLQLQRSLQTPNYYTYIGDKTTWLRPLNHLCKFPYVTDISVTHIAHSRFPILDCSETGCCKGLISLDLSFDYVKSLTSSAFLGLDNLQILDLSGNVISHLPDGIFTSLVSLRKLALTGNPLSVLSLQLFTHNSKLSDITMESFSIVSIAPDMIPVLQQVNMRDHGKLCTEFVNWNFDELLFLRNLRAFSLCVRNESNYDGEFFQKLAHINHLMLKRDSEKASEPLEPALLEDVFSKTSRLESLSLEAKVVENLHSKMFASLSQLRRLSLRNNRFTVHDLTASVFFGLTQLQSLELSGNYFNFDNTTETLLTTLPHLININLDANEVTSLPTNFFDDLIGIEIISLRRNKFDIIPVSLCSRKNAFELLELYLSYNEISVLNEHDLRNCSGLRILELDSNALKHVGSLLKPISSSPFKYLVNLTSLTLGFNRIKQFDFSMIPESLKYLNLRYNHITSFTDVQNVRNKLNLHVLLLDSNRIVQFSINILPSSLRQLYGDINYFGRGAFANQANLEVVITNTYSFNSDFLVREAFANYRSKNGTYFNFEFGDKKECPLAFSSDEVDEYGRHPYGTVPEFGEYPSYNVFPFYNVATSQYSFCIYKRICQECTAGYDPSCNRQDDRMSRLLYCGEIGFDHLPNAFPRVNVNDLFLDGNNIPAVLAGSLDSLDNSLGFSATEKIYLNNSHISVVSNDAFHNQVGLLELHLENNNITTISLEIVRFWGNNAKLFLQNNSISRIEVDSRVGKNDVEDYYLQIDSPRTIFLEDNHLTAIPSTFWSLSRLEELHIQNNIISYLNSSTFKGYSKLTTIVLNNNRIPEVPLLQLHSKSPIQYFYMRNNHVQKVSPKAFNQFSYLKILDLYDNQITAFEGLEFAGLKNLESLNLGDNVIGNIHQQTFRDLHQLNILNLENNRLKSLPSTLFLNLTTLIELHLSGNYIYHLDADIFVNLYSLSTLRLNHSMIQFITGDFKGSHNLQELYLNDNLLLTLEGKIFQTLQNLKMLYLHNNFLTSIEMTGFTNLTSLEILTLNNNKLIKPRMWNLPENLQYINLTNNALACDCDYIPDFRNWLARIRQTKLNIVSSEITCFIDDTKEIPVLQFDLTSCSVSYELPLGVSAGIAILLFLVMSALYYWRTEVQVWVYSRYGVRLFYNAEEDNTKPFDVFISFSNDDAEFVVRDLVPGLRDYKPCVHYKHFPPGAYIADSIIEAVGNSKRTLLVFSNNFLKSPYCKFEFRAAHHKSLEDRCCRLIVLLLEEVDEQSMDQEMKAYFRTNTYLRWDDPAFWRKLYFTMPDAENAQGGPRILNDEQIVVEDETGV